MTAGGPLLALAACLRGDPPAAPDWPAIILLANRTLLTPALFAALDRAGQLDRLPEDARAYLGFLHARNTERNLRLRAQLVEALRALNAAGIEPTLLKGAVRLFLDEAAHIGSRMTRDLDIAVEEGEVAAARACLLGIGYRDSAAARGMERPQDVGALELRHRPSTLSAGYLRRERAQPPQPVERDGVRALVPDAASRALHWIVHDMIKEGDYWHGRIDLRHLHDLAELARTEAELDWAALRDAMPDRLGRNVVETQLLTLHTLFGGSVPPDLRRRMVVRLQHWRRMVAAGRPVAGAPLRLAGSLAWGGRRLRTLPDLGRLFDRGLLERSLRVLDVRRDGAKL